MDLFTGKITWIGSKPPPFGGKEGRVLLHCNQLSSPVTCSGATVQLIVPKAVPRAVSAAISTWMMMLMILFFIMLNLV